MKTSEELIEVYFERVESWEWEHEEGEAGDGEEEEAEDAGHGRGRALWGGRGGQVGRGIPVTRISNVGALLLHSLV